MAQIQYPGTETVEWHGFKRHNFTLAGHSGFIVEPPEPAPGLPWSWCLQWAEAFVPRTPALKLLERGFHHVHFDLFDTFFSPDGIRKAEAFYAMLQSLHFAPKAALIGMSYGGLFAFRWMAEHPETVAALYADAPACDLAFFADRTEADTDPRFLGDYHKQAEELAKAYGCTVKELHTHKLSPINNVKPIADAKIPILAIRSGQDQTVLPKKNIDILAERLTAAGGCIEIMNRELWGHHPHGMDDPTVLADFLLKHCKQEGEEQK